MLSTSGFEKSQIQFGNMYWSYINFLRSGLDIWLFFLWGYHYKRQKTVLSK
jgi:hypothetical protein